MSEAKAMCAPQKPAPNESPVEGCWRMIGLANHAAALGVEVEGVEWRYGRVILWVGSRADVDRLAAETGCDEATWGNTYGRPSDGRAMRLYYRKAPGLQVIAAVAFEVVEAGA